MDAENVGQNPQNSGIYDSTCSFTISSFVCFPLAKLDQLTVPNGQHRALMRLYSLILKCEQSQGQSDIQGKPATQERST